MITLDPKSTALVLIDLQKGIAGRELAPRSGGDVVKAAIETARRFRAAGSRVVLVHVKWSPDMGDAPSQNVDAPMARPAGGLPPTFADFVDGLADPADILVVKRQWGAFYGTDLDLQLRRRGIRTIVIGGIATNFGVESTARCGWEHGYDIVIAENLTATMTQEMHDFAISTILPRIARVAAAKDIELKAGQGASH